MSISFDERYLRVANRHGHYFIVRILVRVNSDVGYVSAFVDDYGNVVY